ncbi:hypothetical protein JTB14_029194 [Gonioctena quinquepunctata]|nr:hypothetical protein JTB14_029194 [Gonioctena quinquepunctata]
MQKFMCYNNINEFNDMETCAEQNWYLSCLITVVEEQRRRSHKDDSKRFNAGYPFNVRIREGYIMIDKQACCKAFMALYGIPARRVESIQASLASKCVSSENQRSKHSIRPHKITTKTRGHMFSHIKSVRERKSHHFIRDTEQIYLPETI